MLIAPNLYSLGNDKGGHVRSYLLKEADDTFTLIDTGYDKEPFLIVRQLESLGKRPRDIKRIVVTHGHKSHIGGLANIQRMSQAEVLCHEEERLIVQGDKKAARVGLPKPWSERPRHLEVWKLQTALHFGIGSHQSCTVSRTIKDGDRVESLEVIETPGHTPGSLSLWHPGLKALFVADTVCTWPERGPWEGFTLNPEEWQESINDLAEFSNVRILCSGHGDPILDGAADVIKGLKK